MPMHQRCSVKEQRGVDGCLILCDNGAKQAPTTPEATKLRINNNKERTSTDYV